MTMLGHTQRLQQWTILSRVPSVWYHGLPNRRILIRFQEHIWDNWDKRVRQCKPPPQTLDQLCQMLQQEWRTIPRNNVRKLIESMPRRCRAVFAVRGGHTRY